MINYLDLLALQLSMTDLSFIILMAMTALIRGRCLPPLEIALAERKIFVYKNNNRAFLARPLKWSPKAYIVTPTSTWH